MHQEKIESQQKYTLSLKFVPAQVRGNNNWSSGEVKPWAN
jgi:hypothetical protein